MKSTLHMGLMSRFSEIVASRTALHFPRERWNDLESKAGPIANEFGFGDVESFVDWLDKAPVTREQVEMLASHLTINETYFWREPKVFEALVKHILPDLVRSREGRGKLLRIWSAGCSAGEEPYSIAMAIHRVIPSPDDWNITILATDINPGILRKANEGIYGEWSFRNAPSWLREKYFLPRDGGRLEIIPEIRKMVTFFYLNLVEDIYPSPLNNTGAMDIIFCRNVLMYFAPANARRVIEGLYRSLVSEGWLMVSSSELSPHLFPQFSSVNFPGAIVYRKGLTELMPPAVFHFEGIPPANGMLQPIDEPYMAYEIQDLPDTFPDSESTMEDERIESSYPVIEEFSDIQEGNDDTMGVNKTESEEKRSSITRAIRSLADKGDLSEALSLCDNAITGDKLDPGLHYLRAVILQEQNSYEEALSSLKRTLYLHPNHVLAYYTRGNLGLRMGDVKSAKKCFENALTLLNACRQEEILPESDGMTAGRLREIIQATISIGAQS